MSELRTLANDVTKNTQDVENYSKEFIELQRQLSQIRFEKFNGVSLFSDSRTAAINNPPDLRPQLSKDSAVDDMGRTYQTFSRQLLTTADGFIPTAMFHSMLSICNICYHSEGLMLDLSDQNFPMRFPHYMQIIM